MTSSSEQGGGLPLVIRLDTGETLTTPEDWLLSFIPEPGERLAAFEDRRIGGDTFLQTIIARTCRGQKAPSLDGRRPADLTFSWWEEKWPEKVFFRTYNEYPRTYHRDRVFWRLGVELVARIEADVLVMKGYRTDVPAHPLEVVEPGLLRNHYMALRPRAPRGGWFCPEQWYGSEPPTSLRRYHELTLWPGPALKTAPVKKPPVASADLQSWWKHVYLPQHPDPDNRPDAEAQLAAAGAYFLSHKPPTKTDMQKLRRHPATPPEWREAGRRPKSAEKSE